MFSALIYNNFKVIEFKSFTSNTKLGMTLADLSDYERDLVKELLDKTLFKTK